ncbi:MAG: folate family ECF transporter S component [Clostridia bacterium]|nr:folate family ECF transporter S component [Clostridia bacterium]
MSKQSQRAGWLGRVSVSPIVYIALMGMLIALEVVLERLIAVNLLTFKLNLAFIPVGVAAYLFGPIGGALCFGLGDIAGSLLFPTGGYNPLFTLTAVLVGLTFGLFLMGEFKWWKVVAPAFLACTIGTLGLNSLWISMFFSPRGYWAVMVGRLPEAGLMFAAECIILIPLLGSGKWMTRALQG